MPHDRGRVADLADVERMVPPCGTLVGADPRHVARRVEKPFAVVPEHDGIGQLAELLTLPENPALTRIGLATRHRAGEKSDGVVGDRERVAKRPRRLDGMRSERREQEGGEERKSCLHCLLGPTSAARAGWL